MSDVKGYEPKHRAEPDPSFANRVNSYNAGYYGNYERGSTGYPVCPPTMISSDFFQGVNDAGWEGHEQMSAGSNYKPPRDA